MSHILTEDDRLQNRIAQRNHRMYPLDVLLLSVTDDQVLTMSIGRKVQGMNHDRKESEGAATPEERGQEGQDAIITGDLHAESHHRSPEHPSENAGADHQASQKDLSSPLTFYASSLASECSNMILAEDIMAHQAPGVPWMSMMANPTQENGNPLSQSAVSSQIQNCTCSPAAGPCPGHMEKMRLELLGEITSPLQLSHSQQQQPHNSHHVVETNNMARLQTQHLSHLSNYSRSSSR